MMNEFRRLLLTALLAVAAIPLFAQSQPDDTTFLFRFVRGNDMLYADFHDNRKELQRLSDCVERFKTPILAGELPLYVDGYCSSIGIKTAYVRANRVKSELITRKGLREECFITRNHAGEGDFVTVRLSVPKAELNTNETNVAETPKDAECSLPVKEQPKEVTVMDSEVAETTTVAMAEEAPKGNSFHRFALRANLLRWATLTPDLGLEWRIGRSWGILLNGSWTSWSWDDKNRRYALWEVAPEVHYYIGKEKRGYVGAMYKVGSFNYKLSDTGRQGDLMGGAITGGYQLRLNKALALDFNLGLGCIHADYDKYAVIDGVRVKRGEGCKNWWDPVSAGVTLTWNLF